MGKIKNVLLFTSKGWVMVALPFNNIKLHRELHKLGFSIHEIISISGNLL
jgi:hypothetical protein